MSQDPEPRPKLVAHMKDGEIFKGYSRDFMGPQASFHLVNSEAGVGSSRRVQMEELKALFFVRTWGRGPGRVQRRYQFDARQIDEPGRRASVRFRDGERIWGYVLDDQVSADGFYLVPANPEDNNIKIFIVRSSLEDLAYLDGGGRDH